jgi:hypothetical protein
MYAYSSYSPLRLPRVGDESGTTARRFDTRAAVRRKPVRSQPERPHVESRKGAHVRMRVWQMISSSIAEEHLPLRSASASSRPQGENLPQWHCLEVQALAAMCCCHVGAHRNIGLERPPSRYFAIVCPSRGQFSQTTREYKAHPRVARCHHDAHFGGSRRGGYWTWWKPSPCRMGPARRQHRRSGPTAGRRSSLAWRPHTISRTGTALATNDRAIVTPKNAGA